MRGWRLSRAAPHAWKALRSAGQSLVAASGAAEDLQVVRILPIPRKQQGRHCVVDGPVADGRVQVRITAPTPRMIARQVAGWGRIEVLAPQSVQAELAGLGAELVGRYGE